MACQYLIFPKAVINFWTKFILFISVDGKKVGSEHQQIASSLIAYKQKNHPLFPYQKKIAKNIVSCTKTKYYWSKKCC